jgi:alginate O-acetyltransferase complex protein AlgJ
MKLAIVALAGLIVIGSLGFAAENDTKTDADPNAARAQRFREVCGKLYKMADADEAGAVVLEDRWIFLPNELRHVSVGEFWGKAAAKVSRATRVAHADPLEAIVHYHEQMKARGIDLLLVPVPPKAVVYADKFPGIQADANGRPPRLDVKHQEFYKLLRSKGVDVLDLTDTLIKARTLAAPKDESKADPTLGEKPVETYCRTDTHFTPAACEIFARAIAEHVKGRQWQGRLERPLADKLKTQMRTVTIRGNLLEAAAKVTKDKAVLKPEKIRARFVGLPDGDTLQPVPDEPSAPITLMGDSHTMFFRSGGDMFAIGAGLADQLMKELGTKLDVISNKGSGARTVRIRFYRAAKDPDYRRAKKLVIWCLSAREFTEATAWGKIPVPGR